MDTKEMLNRLVDGKKNVLYWRRRGSGRWVATSGPLRINPKSGAFVFGGKVMRIIYPEVVEVDIDRRVIREK